MYVLGVSTALVFMIWHFICSVLTVIDYSVWVRLLPDMALSSSFKKAYLTFSLIGIFGFGVGGAPLFLYAYKYGLSYSERVVRLLCGMAVVFFTWSLPFFVIESFLMMFEVRHPLNGVIMVLSTISCVVGACIVWFAYMHFVAKIIHHYHGVDRQITQQDAVHEMPPIRMMSAEHPYII